jgi:TetR/AcrR family transcriptional regulator, regulator of cefoperazone and chloramphenicol sensitivity
MTNKKQQDARTRILSAAGDVFTEKGFEKATIRDICQRAGTNVASVNYYFQDKAGLVNAVLNGWWEASLEKYPPEYPEDAPEVSPLERLRAYVRAQILRTFHFGDVDTETRIRRGKLILREFAKDGPPPEAMHRCIMREVEALIPIIRELIDIKDCPEHALRDCSISVRSQAVHYFLIYLHDRDLSLEREEELLRISEHISTFSLGGVAAIREALA